MGDGDVYGLVEKKCAICGKMFIPAPMHAYKRKYGTGGKTKWFCSYHCLLAWDREHPYKIAVGRKGNVNDG